MSSQYILGVKKGLSEEQWEDVRKYIEKQGGQDIEPLTAAGRESLTGPGFIFKLPTDTVHALESAPHKKFVQYDGKVQASG